MTKRRWIIAIVALILVLGAGVAAAGYVVWQNRHPGTIRGSASTEFETTAEPGATTRPETAVREIPWPTYGYDEQRTRYAPPFDHRPPYRQVWKRGLGTLAEFPPVLAYGRAYIGVINGRFRAIDTETGRIVWEKDFERCMAASPTMGPGVVYVPLMDPFPCREHKPGARGYVAALDADTGRVLWRFDAGVIESSPLVVGRLLYVGSWDKKMYAVDVRTHKVVWSVTTGAARTECGATRAVTKTMKWGIAPTGINASTQIISHCQVKASVSTLNSGLRKGNVTAANWKMTDAAIAPRSHGLDNSPSCGNVYRSLRQPNEKRS